MSKTIDEIERSLEAFAEKERVRFVSDQLQNKTFRTADVRQDFIQRIAPNLHASGHHFFGPDFELGQAYIASQYASQQEQAASPKPSVEKPTVATPAGQSGKQFLIEDIKPSMTTAEISAAWAAIRLATRVDEKRR